MKWVAIGDLEAFVARVSMKFRSGSVGMGLIAQKYRKLIKTYLDFKYFNIFLTASR